MGGPQPPSTLQEVGAVILTTPQHTDRCALLIWGVRNVLDFFGQRDATAELTQLTCPHTMNHIVY